MFCKWCGKYAFVRGGPIAQRGCPVCEWSFFGGQEKVSRDDDPPGEDGPSSHDEDSSDEYRASPVDVSYSSDDSYGYSDFSSSTISSLPGWVKIYFFWLLPILTFLTFKHLTHESITSHLDDLFLIALPWLNWVFIAIGLLVDQRRELLFEGLVFWVILGGAAWLVTDAKGRGKP